MIASRHPLWEDRLDQGAGRSKLDEGYLLMEGRETIGTTPLEAAPDVILKMPNDSYAPFFLGLFGSCLFACLLGHGWQGAAIMGAASAVSLIAWLWPERVVQP
jgi:cytochrome c oxidase subunit 1/cytochrome c oxidase subunit I+III